MQNTFRTFRCPACKGVAHPASGSQHSENMVVCGPCTRKFAAWVHAWTSSKGKGRKTKVSFYDHVRRLEGLDEGLGKSAKAGYLLQTQAKERSMKTVKAGKWAGCGCPPTAKAISTKNRGRGWVCQSKLPKINKKGNPYKPFVKAVCR